MLNNQSIFFVWLELEKRINHRINSMLDRGLIDELAEFHEEYNRTQLESERSFDYTRGIFQAIGFKEFHDYLLLPQSERNSENGKKFFNEGLNFESNEIFIRFIDFFLGIERLKISTRKYSRSQEKWLRMRLLQRESRCSS